MKKISMVVLFSVLVIAVVMLNVFSSGVKSTSQGFNSGSSEAKQGNAVINNSGPSDAGVISYSELARHNSGSDCWISYKNKVYDITEFLPRHPGSAAAIIPYCGTSSEFEKAFTNQHGISKVGLLNQMGIYIGELK